MYGEKERGPNASRRSPSSHRSNLSIYSSNKSSPRISSPESRKPARPISDVTLYASPNLRPGYRNASTQCSPMGETTQNILLKTKVLEAGKQRSEAADKIQASPAKGPSDSNAAALISLQSPKREQRQHKEATGSSPSTIAVNRSCEPKRTQPSKKVLPAKYELCSHEDIVILISDMISELIKTNDNIPLKDVELTRFHSIAPPGISVMDYLQRLTKHATLSPPILLSMVYYIDRLCSLYPAFSINSLTVHRFLIAAATVAAKGLSDSFWNNATYARVGGIKLAELGLLELELLYRLDWRIVPKPEVLEDYYRGLVGRTECYTLDSDVDNAAMMSREYSDRKDDLSTDNKRFSVQDVTGVKWDQ